MEKRIEIFIGAVDGTGPALKAAEQAMAQFRRKISRMSFTGPEVDVARQMQRVDEQYRTLNRSRREQQLAIATLNRQIGIEAAATDVRNSVGANFFPAGGARGGAAGGGNASEAVGGMGWTDRVVRTAVLMRGIQGTIRAIGAGMDFWAARQADIEGDNEAALVGYKKTIDALSNIPFVGGVAAEGASLVDRILGRRSLDEMEEGVRKAVAQNEAYAKSIRDIADRLEEAKKSHRDWLTDLQQRSWVTDPAISDVARNAREVQLDQEKELQKSFDLFKKTYEIAPSSEQFFKLDAERRERDRLIDENARRKLDAQDKASKDARDREIADAAAELVDQTQRKIAADRREFLNQKATAANVTRDRLRDRAGAIEDNLTDMRRAAAARSGVISGGSLNDSYIGVAERQTNTISQAVRQAVNELIAIRKAIEKSGDSGDVAVIGN